jgi:hypothetical protein
VESQSNVCSGELDGGYFFMAADDMLIEPPLRTKPTVDWTSVERIRVQLCYQRCFDDMKTWLESQQAKGQSVFVKEHATFMATPEERSHLAFGIEHTHHPSLLVEDKPYSTRSSQNFTVLPDQFLQTWLPTFLIRHPALAFPSYYRTIIDLDGADQAAADNYASFKNISIKHSRQLYDLYVQWRDKLPCSDGKRGVWPIVLDAEDVVSCPETVTLYCALLNLDAGNLRFNWDALKQKDVSQMGRAQQVMRSTLSQSSGIDRTKTQGTVHLASEVEKWVAEFGAAAAQEIARKVYEEMDDYEYLRSNRLRAASSLARHTTT